ncbi:hypothetical protein SAM_0301 [Streptococcus agalactiae CJB111]|nr:hypothetical protein SAM_0301 [Streptococcus agalactiae CJB111]
MTRLIFTTAKIKAKMSPNKAPATVNNSVMGNRSKIEGIASKTAFQLNNFPAGT